jgi:hypothetical protein
MSTSVPVKIAVPLETVTSIGKFNLFVREHQSPVTNEEHCELLLCVMFGKLINFHLNGIFFKTR